jgi:hypothetical protein
VRADGDPAGVHVVRGRALRGVPFTPCQLRVSWGDVPPDGAFLRTRAGSAYRVERVAGRTLHCTRWPPDEVPADAMVWTWEWGSRG